MRFNTLFPSLIISCLVVTGCGSEKKNKNSDEIANQAKETVTPVKIPELRKEIPEGLVTPDGMVWVPGGQFLQGAVSQDNMAMAHEKPTHPVAVDGFFMDVTEVTNSDFRKFVEATDYKTVAERDIIWEEIQKQLPEGTQKPHDSILQPGSLIFKKTDEMVPNLYDFSQWWSWKIGADWQHPKGPASNIDGKDDHPVVHVSYEDAVAYCEWVGRRLPTEAEWELAARGNLENKIFFWGDDKSVLAEKANSWEGEFPVSNTKIDGYEGTAPVKSYSPNSLGIYDLAGNVWEFTNDWYNSNYYNEMYKQGTTLVNPTGAETSYNQSNPYVKEKVIKGGSFLCSESYCASYRVSARMGNSLDSAQEHLGFRTVATVEMIENEK